MPTELLVACLSAIITSVVTIVAIKVHRRKRSKAEDEWKGLVIETAGKHVKQSSDIVEALVRWKALVIARGQEKQARGERDEAKLPCDTWVHFTDPEDDSDDGAVCGTSLEAPSHPTEMMMGARSTYRRRLVTCPACVQRMSGIAH